VRAGRRGVQIVLVLALLVSGLLPPAASFSAVPALAAPANLPSAATAGTAWLWGANYYGALGDGARYNCGEPCVTKFRVNPVPALLPTTVKAISLSTPRSVFLDSDGRVWWTGEPFEKNLFDSDAESAIRQVPQLLLKSDGTPLTDVVEIAAGSNRPPSGSLAAVALARTSDGQVWAWGSGRLSTCNPAGSGCDNSTAVVRPVLDVSGNPFTASSIAAGGGFQMALKSDGSVWTWGTGFWGTIGNGSDASQTRPVRVQAPRNPGSGISPGPLSGVSAIAAGGDFALALLNDGSVVSWGFGEYLGILGTAPDLCGGNHDTPCSLYPVQVQNPNGSTLSGVRAISATQSHSLAVRTDNTVRGWGYKGGGALGDGTTTDQQTPVTVQAPGVGPLS
jgi:alpha-tubulin suppressor-like RCC1 family protein